MLGHGFYKRMLGWLGIICWTCNHEGYRVVNCPMKWGLPSYDYECNRQLKNQGWMRRPDIEITQADGGHMRIKGMMKLLVRVGG